MARITADWLELLAGGAVLAELLLAELCCSGVKTALEALELT